LDKVAASVVIYTARPIGLMTVLKSLVYQEFSYAWEIVVVDACHGYRQEEVASFTSLYTSLYTPWTNLQRVVHIPPLWPVNRSWRSSWDIPLYMNTAWAHARGEVIVQIEDFMEATPGWLDTHHRNVKSHPNLVCIGDVVDASGGGHYGRETNVELQDKLAGGLHHVLNNPNLYVCANAQNYGMWLSGNTSFLLQHVLNFGGTPEWPTHWPESLVAPEFFKYGLSMWPILNAKAVHHAHAPGMIVNHIMKIVNGDLAYEPVRVHSMTDVPEPDHDLSYYKRDLKAFRKSIGLWT
jgi:hypothetical protein